MNKLNRSQLNATLAGVHRLVQEGLNGPAAQQANASTVQQAPAPTAGQDVSANMVHPSESGCVSGGM